MPVTSLDPRTALIVIDLQKGIAAFPTAHPVSDIVDRTNLLLGAFRRHDLPVVLVVVTGAAPGRTEQPRRHRELTADFADLLAGLDHNAQDICLEKRTPGAFPNTGLEEQLRKLGVTQVVIVGIATSGGVESTARQAYELGFNVTLAIDAMTDASAEAHAHSIQKVFPRIGETGATEDVIAILERTKAR
jgi:nicotinamidase-related amidase